MMPTFTSRTLYVGKEHLVSRCGFTSDQRRGAERLTYAQKLRVEKFQVKSRLLTLMIVTPRRTALAAQALRENDRNISPAGDLWECQ
jgi:hypothetical protein